MQIDLTNKKVFIDDNCPHPHITISDLHPAYQRLLNGDEFELDLKSEEKFKFKT